MIKENTTQLGPFPLGIDNKHNTRDRVFDQVEGNLPRLTVATNVDIDSDGWIRRRRGVTTARTGTNIEGAWLVDNRFFIQEGSVLYERDSSGTETSRVTGLSGRISITKHADAIWLTDGTNHKVIRGTSVYNWGLSIPTITVTASSTVSSLEAGRYLVQASCTDSFGNEGPVSALTAVTLTAGQSISVSCTLPSDAVSLNIYCSKKDQKETTFVGQKTQAQLPFVFSTFPNEADPPVTNNMTGPWSNTNGIFSFRAWMFMWRDNFVARSEALEPHLFDPINIFQFEDTVTTCAPVLNGFFVGTNSGLYFVADLPGLGSDQDTTGWVPFNKYKGKIYPGSKVIGGTKIPSLETRENVALFVSDDGLIAGMPDGSVRILNGNYEFTTASRYSIEYSDSSIDQLLIGIVS